MSRPANEGLTWREWRDKYGLSDAYEILRNEKNYSEESVSYAELFIERARG
jgi:hypothetical protein